MNLAEYLSFVYLGEEPENNTQYVTTHPKEYYPEKENALNKELAKFYVKRVFNLETFKPSAIIDFLNYHYGKYADNKLDFIFLVEDLSVPLRIGDYDFYLWPLWLNNIPLNKLITQWVSEKRDSIKAQGTSQETKHTRLISTMPVEEIRA